MQTPPRGIPPKYCGDGGGGNNSVSQPHSANVKNEVKNQRALANLKSKIKERLQKQVKDQNKRSHA